MKSKLMTIAALVGALSLPVASYSADDKDSDRSSPKAFVKLKAGAAAFTLKELQGFLKDKLGKHEMIHALDIRGELPKTAVGKISKKDLYDEEEKKAKAS